MQEYVMEPKVFVYLILSGLTGLIIIIGNFIVLLVLIYNNALRSATNSLIASLSLADCLVGLVGIPCVITNYLGYPSNFYGCLFMCCVIIILTQISIFGLLVIAVERCISIKFPLFHRVHFTGRRVRMMIGAAWFSGMTVGSVPMFGWHKPQNNLNNSTFVCAFDNVIDMSYMVYFNFFICVLVPIVFMYVTYLYIYHVVRNKLNDLSQLQNSYSRMRAGKLARESRATRRIFIVLVIFTICWLPIHIANCVTLFANQTNSGAMAFVVLLSHMNSAINPLIYTRHNTRFTAAMRKILGLKSSVIAMNHVRSVHEISQEILS